MKKSGITMVNLKGIKIYDSQRLKLWGLGALSAKDPQLWVKERLDEGSLLEVKDRQLELLVWNQRPEP